MSDHVKQVHEDCAKLLKEFASFAEKKVPDEPPGHESLFLLLYDYGAENQQQRNMAKDNVCNVELDVIKNNPANDGICVQVDDEAEFTKDIGLAACSRTMEGILMTKQDWFDHAAADGDVAVA